MMTRNCCPFHAQNLKEFAELTHAIAEDIASDNLSRFAMYYEPPQEPDSNCMLHIEGQRTTLITVDGSLSVSTPRWVAKSWRREADGKLRVPPQKLRRSGIVQDIFEQIANDTTSISHTGVFGGQVPDGFARRGGTSSWLGENGPSASNTVPQQ